MIKAKALQYFLRRKLTRLYRARGDDEMRMTKEDLSISMDGWISVIMDIDHRPLTCGVSGKRFSGKRAALVSRVFLYTTRRLVWGRNSLGFLVRELCDQFLDLYTEHHNDLVFRACRPRVHCYPQKWWQRWLGMYEIALAIRYVSGCQDPGDPIHRQPRIIPQHRN